MFDLEKRQSPYGVDDRLERPWSVFFLGLLSGVALFAIRAHRAGAIDRLFKPDAGAILVVFSFLALVLSAAYAIIGSRVSLRLARNIVGAVGLLVILAGTAFLVYQLQRTD
jgi:uncharacterized membrane protein